VFEEMRKEIIARITPINWNLLPSKYSSRIPYEISIIMANMVRPVRLSGTRLPNLSESEPIKRLSADNKTRVE
jgi:hypothetical protein